MNLRRFSLLAVLSAGLGALVSAQPAPQDKAAPVFADGQAQIVPAFQDSSCGT